MGRILFVFLLLIPLGFSGCTTKEIDQTGPSEVRPPVADPPTPETFTFEGQITSGHAGGFVVKFDGVRVFEDRPDNATDVLIELAVESAKMGPVNQFEIEAVNDNEIIAETASPNSNGIYVIHLSKSAYSDGNLNVNYFPADDSLSIEAKITLKVTAFFDESFNDAFSAFSA